MKLSDYVFQFVAEQKVRQVFLISGGGAMHLVDSLGKTKGIEYIPCQHEQAASIAAGAYAQYTNNLGVALVTTGPGGTNAVTGVAAAWVESIPLMMISGQVKRPDLAVASGVRTLGFQEIDIVSVVKPITKYAVTVLDPEEIRFHLEKAAYIARSDRFGPVWIDIPLDVQAAQIDEATLKGFIPPVSDGHTTSRLAEQTVKIAALITDAKRPVIIAGCGIKLSNAEDAFLRLVEKLKIPVLTTWKAIDLMPEDHPWFFGRPGAIGQRGANFIQQNADLVISIGARLDLGQIGYSYENFAREAKKVIVDIDPAEIKKLKFDIEVAVCGDAGEFINTLESQIGTREAAADPEWLSRCREWKQKYPVVLPEYLDKKDYVSTYVLIDSISAELGGADLIVPGSSGACSDILMQTFKVKQGQRILNTPGLGAMGFGLPASIGACLASGRKRTVCVNGDGGFQLNIQELSTVARLKLPIKYFILNNQGYGSIKNTQRNYFNGNYVASGPESGVVLPDITKVADAFGIATAKISNQENLRDRIREILSMPGPVICDVKIDPAEPTSPKLTSSVRSDGTIISKPMEDMWPFLDREEFRSNMIVKPLAE
jgi:acetolactate synthase-1/2/3 large subunit